jgi:hypothetical protein
MVMRARIFLDIDVMDGRDLIVGRSEGTLGPAARTTLGGDLIKMSHTVVFGRCRHGRSLQAKTKTVEEHWCAHAVMAI